MTAPDDLWRHQPEPPPPDLDALPATPRTTRSKGAALLADAGTHAATVRVRRATEAAGAPNPGDREALQRARDEEEA